MRGQEYKSLKKLSDLMPIKCLPYPNPVLKSSTVFADYLECYF